MFIIIYAMDLCNVFQNEKNIIFKSNKWKIIPSIKWTLIVK
jgi:hypothetical protein